MTPLDMIAEWRKGCTCAAEGKPEECHECTTELINAMELWLRKPLWQRIWLRSRANEWLRIMQMRRGMRHDPTDPVDNQRLTDVYMALLGTQTPLSDVLTFEELDSWAFRRALASRLRQCESCAVWRVTFLDHECPNKG